MTHVDCSGDESKVVDCQHNSYEIDDGKVLVAHAEVAGVNCLGMTLDSTITVHYYCSYRTGTRST